MCIANLFTCIGEALCYLVRTSLRLGAFAPETIPGALHGAFLGEDKSTLALLFPGDEIDAKKLVLYHIGDNAMRNLSESYASLVIQHTVISLFNCTIPSCKEGSGENSVLQVLYQVKERTSTVAFLYSSQSYRVTTSDEDGTGERSSEMLVEHEGLRPVDEPCFEFDPHELAHEIAFQYFKEGDGSKIESVVALAAVLTNARICLLRVRPISKPSKMNLKRTIALSPPPKGVPHSILSILWAGPVLLLRHRASANLPP